MTTDRWPLRIGLGCEENFMIEFLGYEGGLSNFVFRICVRAVDSLWVHDSVRQNPGVPPVLKFLKFHLCPEFVLKY